MRAVAVSGVSDGKLPTFQTVYQVGYFRCTEHAEKGIAAAQLTVDEFRKLVKDALDLPAVHLI